MGKKQLILLLGLAAAVTIAGCGKENNDKETEFTTSTPEEVAVEDLDTAELLVENETESESEIPLDPITPSDYLVKNVSEYITLGDLTGLAATEYTYDITDDLVQETIQSDLEMFGEEVEVERPAASGDTVYADITSAVQNEADSSSSDSTYFIIGDEDYGAEFDQKLIGASAGDSLNFSIAFDDDVPMDDWANKTVDFDVTVTSVCELDIPEYNEEFVTEYTDYDSVSDYEAAVREALVTGYDNISYSDTAEELFEAAIDQSVFSGYPQELYDSCKEELLSVYGMFAGTSDPDEIYDTLGITEEEINAEVEVNVNRQLLVSAICEENDLEVTEEEYFSYLEEYADYYGYDTAYSFEQDYTRSALVWTLYEEKAADVLYQSAQITKEAYTEATE